MALLLNIVRSGTPPSHWLRGLELIIGDPNLINPTTFPVVVSCIINFICLPGASSYVKEATNSNKVLNVE